MYTAYYFPFENCRDGIIPRLPLFDPKNGYFLKDAVLKTSATKAGKFTFTIPVDDERVLQVLQCWVTVVSDNVRRHDEDTVGENVIWVGRPTQVERDLYGNRTYTCEGVLGMLNDTVCVAKPYPSIYNSIPDFINFLVFSLWTDYQCYTAAVDANTDASTVFRNGTWYSYDGKKILYKETKIPEGAKVCVPQVDYNNGYYLSSVVYEDSACKTKVLKPDGNGFDYIDNISFVRYWTQAETAMELLQSRIIDYFGGNFQAEVVDPYTKKEPLTDVLHTGCIRYAYRDPSNHTIKTQKLELGGNITDVSSSYIAEDFYTGIVPVSSSNADNTTGESDATETMIYPEVTESDFDSDGNRKIDIKPYAAFSFYGGNDTEITPSNLVVWFTGGKFGDYYMSNREYPASRAFNQYLLNKYGPIVRKVNFSFSENNPDKYTKREAVVAHVLALEEPKATFSVSAVDFGLVEDGVECLQAGFQVEVVYTPLGIDEWMTIEELEIHLDDPTQCKVTLNGSLDSIAKIVARG